MRRTLATRLVRFALAGLVIFAIALGGTSSTEAQDALSAPARMAASDTTVASSPPYGGGLAFGNTGYASAASASEINLPSTVSYTMEADFQLSQAWGELPPASASIPLFSKDGYHDGVEIRRTCWSSPSYHCDPLYIMIWHEATHGTGYAFGSDLQTSTWYHIAVVNDAAEQKIRVYLDGVLKHTRVDTLSISDTTALLIGCRDSSLCPTSQKLLAMDEIRISDVARYTGNFVPATSPFACDGNTRALWHFDEPEGSTTFHDSCGGEDNVLTGMSGAHAVTPPSSVTISGPITGATNTGHSFSATASPVTATLPITYTWSPAPDSGQSTASAIYSWSSDGDRTITATAENVGGVATDTHNISLHTPVGAVVIDGPVAGRLDASYTFTATVDPLAATMPVAYTWTPGPNAGQGASVASYAWSFTGVHVITVTAGNVGGVASDTLSISIKQQYNLYLPLLLRQS